MLKGNAYAAYSHASKALSSGLTGDNAAGVNGVKGAAEIVKAQYGAAVSSESAAVDNADNLFNKGLGSGSEQRLSKCIDFIQRSKC
jgi:hypothetical protein